MKAFVQLLTCHLKGFLRDRGAFFWSFAFPAFFILIFGMVFSKAGSDRVRFAIGVITEDNSPTAQDIIKGFEQVPVFDVKRGKLNDLKQQLQDGKLRALVVVPARLESAFASGGATLKVYYDPAQQQTSQTVLGIMRQVISGMNQFISRAPTLLRADEQPIQTLSGKGKTARYIVFLLPGILSMSIMQLGLFSAIPTVLFREQGILKRIGATPLPRSTFALSQMAMRILIGIAQTLWILGLGSLVFQFRSQGNLLLLLAFVVIGVVTFTIIGALLGSLAKTQETAMPLVQLVNFPFMFLSGVFFPVEIVPDFMQPVVKAIPATYLGKALRDITMGTIQWSSLGMDALVMAAWGIACLLLAFRFFRWE